MQRSRRALVVAALVGLLWPAVARGQVSFTPLGSLAGAVPGSEAHDVSADGSVVVGGCTPSATCNEAWRWTAGGGIQGLGFLPGETDSVATATSADGSVVFGVSGTIFRWTSGGGMLDIGAGLPAFDQIIVRGASDDGLVAVGGFVDTATLQGGAYRWTSGVGIEVLEPFTIPNFVTFFGISPDGATIVGGEGPPDDLMAFYRTDLGKTFLPELPNELPCQCGSHATALSDDALTVVGVSHEKPFRWTPAQGTLDLGLLPGSEGGEARDVSADGDAVVGDAYTTGSPRPFVWTLHGGMRDLTELLEDGGVDLTGWTLLEAVAVSSDGTVIAGNGINPSGDREAWRAVVPRPPAVPALPPGGLWALAGMLTTAGAVLVLTSRRRSRGRRGSGLA